MTNGCLGLVWFGGCCLSIDRFEKGGRVASIRMHLEGSECLTESTSRCYVFVGDVSKLSLGSIGRCKAVVMTRLSRLKE